MNNKLEQTVITFKPEWCLQLSMKHKGINLNKRQFSIYKNGFSIWTEVKKKLLSAIVSHIFCGSHDKPVKSMGHRCSPCGTFE